MRILCDVNILVRTNERSSGPVRALLLSLLEKGHILLTSSEILVELARVLRYPRLQALFGLSEEQIYNYVQFLREVSQPVIPDYSLRVSIRDPKDIVVLQTAVSGQADITGVKPQQVQRYEATEYESASFTRIRKVARALGLTMPRPVRLVRNG